MDYRCPVCHAELGRRKYAQAVIARMEIDCSHCHQTIHLHVHPVEAAVSYGAFGIALAIAGAAYWLQNPTWLLVAIGVAMLPALVLPLVERVMLRDWPRYASRDGRVDG